MKNIYPKHRLQKGFTLIEIAIVIAVVGVLMAAVIGRSLLTKDDTDITSELQTMVQVKECLAGIYSNSIDYSGITNTVAKNNNCVPTSSNGSGTTIRHRWSNSGGSVTITPVNTNTNFAMTYTQIDGGICNKLANTAIPAFTQVTVNGNAVANVSDVSTRCSQTAANTLAFIN